MQIMPQAALARDVKNELEATLNLLSGKGKGSKGKAPRGAERKKLWEEVKALRKEYVSMSSFCNDYQQSEIRYRQREGGVVKSVLSEAQARSEPLSMGEPLIGETGSSRNMPYFWRPAVAEP